MKKRVFAVLLFLLVFSAVFVSAATNQTGKTNIDSKAYTCIESIVNTKKCSGLSTEEKIFSLLALGKCKTELVSDADTDGCWPDGNCKIKLTSQAILGLKHVNTNIKKYYDWLISQKKNFENLDWFIQVESPTAAACTVEYSGSSYDFAISEDKKITGSAGSCLTIFRNYWFQVRPECYSNEFKISCDTSFITSLLYRWQNSQTFYVLEQTESASGGGTTTEKLSASCFAEGGQCTYEGTLWAAIVLKYLGYNDTSYLPYLIALADQNPKYIPESFLYSLTDNFKIELISRQKEKKYWSESGDRFYDTAVALLPFQNEDLAEKTSTKSWLGELQGTDGCWQANLKNTAFLLYSIWPRKIVSPDIPSGGKDCAALNYFCMSGAACLSAKGDTMNNTGCFGTNICCSKAKQLDSCSVQGGSLCNTASGEECLGGSVIQSLDSNSGKSCCVQGSCGVKQASQCEIQAGFCRSSCLKSEKVSPYACTSSDVCCMEKKSSGVWVIIVLVLLIILTVLGIIFRKQLKPIFLKVKNWLQTKFKFLRGKGKPAPSAGGARFPPAPSTRTVPGMVPRKIMPQPVARPAPAKPAEKKTEFDDVLKKLKEIGK